MTLMIALRLQRRIWHAGAGGEIGGFKCGGEQSTIKEATHHD